MKITIEVSRGCVEALMMLADDGKAESALMVLAERARDGVARLGSEERAWLVQAFGEAFASRHFDSTGWVSADDDDGPAAKAAEEDWEGEDPVHDEDEAHR